MNICFLDIDGVLADFSKQVYNLTGHNCELVKGKNKNFLSENEQKIDYDISYLVDNSCEFWISMPKTPYADHLLNFCTNTFDKVILLSSYIPEPLDKSRFNRVKKLKLDWVKNNFEKKLTTIITNSRKSAYILPDQNNYLIDDTYKNIIDWRNHGGMAIFHKRYPITKKILNKITTKYIHPNKIILNNYIIKSGENS